MYKVKRFSKSRVIVDQRCYGLLGDFVNKLRKSSYDKLDKSINKSIKSRNITSIKMNNPTLNIEPVNNPEIEMKLRSRSKDFKSEVIGKPYGNEKNTTIRSKDTNLMDLMSKTRSTDKEDEELFNNVLKTSKHIILHKPGSGSEFLAHEVGHVMNREGRNPIRKFISNKAADLSTDKELNNESSKGLLTSAKNYIKGSMIVNEESKASKNALKLLRESGASKEELELAKRNLNEALNTYKDSRSISFKTPLKNTIKPKD